MNPMNCTPRGGIDYGASRTGAEPARIAAFWARYAKALAAAQIAEKRQVWFQRDCERFIAWIQPKRLAQTERTDVAAPSKSCSGIMMFRRQ